jgi:large subunit ribosomal protein L21
MNFAVIKTGGKQYKVAEGNNIMVEKLDTKEGEEFDFSEILLVGDTDSNDVKIGMPYVEGAKVTARIIENKKGKKTTAFKFSSKTRYKKKKGHRQTYSKIEILKITA